MDHKTLAILYHLIVKKIKDGGNKDFQNGLVWVQMLITQSLDDNDDYKFHTYLQKLAKVKVGVPPI